jgi:biotin carboxylase
VVSAGPLKLRTRAAFQKRILAKYHRIQKSGLLRRPQLVNLLDEAGVNMRTPSLDAASIEYRKNLTIRSAQPGARVPPDYDSLLAKLIVHGRDRREACARLQSALRACTIEGVETNLGLHRSIAAAPEFLRGGIDTAGQVPAARQPEAEA